MLYLPPRALHVRIRSFPSSMGPATLVTTCCKASRITTAFGGSVLFCWSKQNRRTRVVRSVKFQLTPSQTYAVQSKLFIWIDHAWNTEAPRLADMRRQSTFNWIVVTAANTTAPFRFRKEWGANVIDRNQTRRARSKGERMPSLWMAPSYPPPSLKRSWWTLTPKVWLRCRWTCFHSPTQMAAGSHCFAARITNGQPKHTPPCSNVDTVSSEATK